MLCLRWLACSVRLALEEALLQSRLGDAKVWPAPQSLPLLTVLCPLSGLGVLNSGLIKKGPLGLWSAHYPDCALCPLSGLQTLYFACDRWLDTKTGLEVVLQPSETVSHMLLTDKPLLLLPVSMKDGLNFGALDKCTPTKRSPKGPSWMQRTCCCSDA